MTVIYNIIELMLTKKHTTTILTILYFSLFFGVYLNEDSLGGAFSDYKGLFYISEEFRDDFFYSFLNYDEIGNRHSPFFYILRSALPFNEIFQRIFFLHIYLLIPIFFYKSLKKIFKTTPKNNLKLLAFVLLLFPTYRSYSIWPDPHLLGVLFFTISIYFFLKFKENKENLKNSVLNTIYLALSAYSSPNFGIFVIYFFYEFYLRFDISKKLILIIFLNIILSIPFFYYLFYLDVNFIFKDNSWDIGENFYSKENISNKILIISSIFCFYLIPILNHKKIISDFNLMHIIDIRLMSFILFFLFCCYFFDFTSAYNLTNSGGGFFYNISKFLFNNNYLFYLINFLAFIFIGKASFANIKNCLLFLCLVLSNPQVTIWQANFSPTLFCLILLLFSIDFIKKNFALKRIFFIYLYFGSYLMINFAKNILI